MMNGAMKAMLHLFQLDTRELRIPSFSRSRSGVFCDQRLAEGCVVMPSDRPDFRECGYW